MLSTRSRYVAVCYARSDAITLRLGRPLNSSIAGLAISPVSFAYAPLVDILTTRWKHREEWPLSSLGMTWHASTRIRFGPLEKWCDS